MAGVLHNEYEVSPFGKIALHCLLLSDIFAEKPDRKHAAGFTHGMVRVGTKIHQNLMYLRGIGKHGVFPGGNFLANLNGAWQGGFQKFQRLLYDEVGLDGLSFLIMLPAEGKYLLDKLLGSITGFQYLLNFSLQVF
jgi:hypothetical protein